MSKFTPLRGKKTFTESRRPSSDVWHRLRYISAFRYDFEFFECIDFFFEFIDIIDFFEFVDLCHNR